MKRSTPGQFPTCIRNFHSCPKEKNNAWTFFCMKISKPCHYRVCLVCFTGAWQHLLNKPVTIVARWLIDVPSWLYCRFIKIAFNTSLSWLVYWISTSPELEKLLISWDVSKVLVTHLWEQDFRKSSSTKHKGLQLFLLYNMLNTEFGNVLLLSLLFAA